MAAKFTDILHLGIVVRDLEKTVAIYENELGIGPWTIDEPAEFFKDKIKNDPRGLQIRTAICRSIGYEIELVQPIGPGFYQDWLDEHGPSMHHVVMKSNLSYEEAIKLGEKLSPNSHYMDAVLPDGTPMVSYISLKEETGLILECGAPHPDSLPPIEEVEK